MDDFDDYVYDSTRSGDEVDYIYFTSLPSSSKGTLYYDGAARTRSAKTTISIMTKLTICSSSPMMTTRAL